MTRVGTGLANPVTRPDGGPVFSLARRRPVVIRPMRWASSHIRRAVNSPTSGFR